jgi:hypothetical protein
MSHFSTRADAIPGLVTAGWVFEGTTMDDNKVSLVWLDDNGSTTLLDVSGGIAAAAQTEGLTPRMRSYLTGISEIGGYFRRRKTVDEDEVTRDDIEAGAIVFAFPRVAMNIEARSILKKHLDLLQRHGLVGEIAFSPNKPMAAGGSEPENSKADDDVSSVAKAVSESASQEESAPGPEQGKPGAAGSDEEKADTETKALEKDTPAADPAPEKRRRGFLQRA